MSLKYKISLSTILIVLLILTSTLFFLQKTFESRIDMKINEQFRQSNQIYTSFNERNGEVLSLSADITTYGSVFVENLKTRDKETISYAILEAQRTLGTFDLMIALDENFISISSNIPTVILDVSYENTDVINDLFIEDIPEDSIPPIILRPFLSDGKLYMTQAVAIENDIQREGYVIIGYEINNNFVNDIKASVSTDISFFNAKDIIASSLHRYQRYDLENIIKNTENIDSLIQTKSTHRVVLKDERFLISYVPLNKTSSIYYVLATSYDKEFSAFADIQKIILFIGGIAFLIAIVYGFVFGNQIVTPVKRLVWAVQEIDNENYNVAIENPSKDEIGTLSKSFNHMAKALGERFELLKFVSKNTHEMIKKKGVGNLELGGERKVLTMFFSDIRGFTAFSEKREPEEVIEMLNIYLRKQAEIVQKYGGDIDKFVGDELMAIFEGDDADFKAVLAAREIQQVIETLNENYHNDIFVGIGINSGEVISGNMGSENRIDHTVLGNNVNLAARLCSKAGAKQIIISEAVYANIPQKKLLKPLEAIEVKGISEPVQIYEVLV